MHYCVVVLLTPDATDFEAGVSALLAPFDDNLEVPEYEKECYCLGEEAEAQATARAGAVAGTRRQIGDEFKAVHGEKQQRLQQLTMLSRPATPEEQTEYVALSSELSRLLELAMAPYNQAYREALDAHPLKDQPDPNCEECQGHGRVLSTSNPQGKWDWWQIGGRFTGFFDSDYDPRHDPANVETCPFCGGTGVRTDFAFYFVEGEHVATVRLDPWPESNGDEALTPEGTGETEDTEESEHADEGLTIRVFDSEGQEFDPSSLIEFPEDKGIPTGAEQRPYCNACDGEGTRFKWPTGWERHEGDIVAICALSQSAPLPYALITPDGAWHQEVDDLGMPLDQREAATQVWSRRYRELLNEHFHCIAVACDLHG